MCDDGVHNEAVQVKDTELSWNIENLAASHDLQEFLQASEFENIPFTVPKYICFFVKASGDHAAADEILRQVSIHGCPTSSSNPNPNSHYL